MNHIQRFTCVYWKLELETHLKMYLHKAFRPISSWNPKKVQVQFENIYIKGEKKGDWKGSKSCLSLQPHRWRKLLESTPGVDNDVWRRRRRSPLQWPRGSKRCAQILLANEIRRLPLIKLHQVLWAPNAHYPLTLGPSENTDKRFLSTVRPRPVLLH